LKSLKAHHKHVGREIEFDSIFRRKSWLARNLMNSDHSTLDSNKSFFKMSVVIWNENPLKKKWVGDVENDILLWVFSGLHHLAHFWCFSSATTTSESQRDDDLQSPKAHTHTTLAPIARLISFLFSCSFRCWSLCLLAIKDLGRKIQKKKKNP
jgi:hypothetical protein